MCGQSGIIEKNNYKSPIWRALEDMGCCRVNVKRSREKPTQFQCALHVGIRSDQIFGSLEEAIQFHDAPKIRQSLPESITSGEVVSDAYHISLPEPSNSYEIDVYYKVCKYTAILTTDEISQHRVKYKMGSQQKNGNKRYIIDVPICGVCMESYSS